MKEIVLCKTPRGCCPKVFLDKDEVRIVDDYDNEVYMKKDQLMILAEKAKNGEFD